MGLLEELIARAEAADSPPDGPVSTAEAELHVGEPIVVDGPSPSSPYLCVFEDDGHTGYFYGLDAEHEDQPILDALHIYDVEQVTDRDKPSKIMIVWSATGKQAMLVINRYPHAVFDFEAARGCCRSGFPGPNEEWTSVPHDWDDALLEPFRKK